MSVKYRGELPDRNYSTHDFLDKKIVLAMLYRWRDYQNRICFRAVFRSNGLLGEIRSTYHSNKGGLDFEYAVDIYWEWGENTCLTTECKSIREAKSILYMWFKSKGFVIPKEVSDSNWRKGHYAFNNVQLKLFI